MENTSVTKKDPDVKVDHQKFNWQEKGSGSSGRVEPPPSQEDITEICAKHL